MAWTTEPAEHLSDHGDRQVPPGALNLAVNVWAGPPAWLRAALAEVDLAGYPDPSAGAAAAADRHGVPASACRLLNGAAEAFWALAYGLRKRIARLTRPGRTVVVDEAFDDFLPDATGLAAMGLPGVLCIRSLTKLWGLAGLRVGYALGPPDVVARLAAAVQPWPVNCLAARAVELLSHAETARRERARAVAAARAQLIRGLAGLPVEVWASPANFVLLRSGRTDLRERLLDAGIAVRRADTFPGLDAHYLRVAVTADPASRARFLAALARALRPA
ncbi:MAG: aminotransferase class I/II-fold pyridoxal phosphate-dependent enzyme [Frankiaceae bacterium]